MSSTEIFIGFLGFVGGLATMVFLIMIILSLDENKKKPKSKYDIYSFLDENQICNLRENINDPDLMLYRYLSNVAFNMGLRDIVLRTGIELYKLYDSDGLVLDIPSQHLQKACDHLLDHIISKKEELDLFHSKYLRLEDK